MIKDVCFNDPRGGREDLVRLFLERGADPVEADAESWATPLAWRRRSGITLSLRSSSGPGDHERPDSNSRSKLTQYRLQPAQTQFERSDSSKGRKLRRVTVGGTAGVATRRMGTLGQRSTILSVPTVIVGEWNYVLNPAHPDVARIAFAEPEPFRFDCA